MSQARGARISYPQAGGARCPALSSSRRRITRGARSRPSRAGLPVYGASLVHIGRLGQAGWQQLERVGVSNRCALITSAHSPCWMEVGENAAPDWAQCPRNPEFVAMNILVNLHNDLEAATQADRRLLASVRALAGLMRIRDAGGPH